MITDYIVEVDFGHGINTLGKMSPDGRLKEWAYSRLVGREVIDALRAAGVDARPVVTEDYDVKINSTEYKAYDRTLGDTPWSGKKAIKSRVLRVNEVCYANPGKKVILVSIHCNASGADGKWKDARGFSVFVSKKASSNSKRLSECFYQYAKNNSMLGNRSVPKPVDGNHFWTWSWTKYDIGILTETVCPAVLTENFFQDNKGDVEYLLSEKGRKQIVDMHVNSILEYMK